jgi:hypothetical protein
MRAASTGFAGAWAWRFLGDGVICPQPGNAKTSITNQGKKTRAVRFMGITCGLLELLGNAENAAVGREDQKRPGLPDSPEKFPPHHLVSHRPP